MRAPRLLAVSVSLLLSLAAAVGVDAAAAGPPGDWTRISQGQVRNIDEPGTYRAADGTLYVVHHRQRASGDSYDVVRIRPDGTVRDRVRAVGLWDSLASDPKILDDGMGLRLVFSGIRDTSVADTYQAGNSYSAVAAYGTNAWTLTGEVQGDDGTAYSSYGTGVTLWSGAVVVAWPLNSTFHWSVGAGSPTETFTRPDCCLYNVSLAERNGAVWAAWYENGGSASTTGIFTRRLLPSLGPVMKAPGSSSPGAGGPSAVSPDQAVPIVSTPQGVRIAYCQGYPTCDRIALWRPGADSVRQVPGSGHATAISLSAHPSGALWVAWARDHGGVKAVRLGTDGDFGQVHAMGSPPPVTDRVAVDAGPGRPTVLVNNGAAILHQQVTR